MKSVLIVLALVVGAVITTAWAQGNQAPPTTWEYKFEYSIRESKANELGADGWELVSISLTTGGSSVREYAFKRVKKN